MRIWTYIACTILIIPTLFLCYSLIQSALEKESRAVRRLSFLLFIWVLVLFFFIFFTDQEVMVSFVIAIASIIIIVSIIFFFPWPEKGLIWKRGQPDQVDERNIMFSRAELIPGTDRYESYYKEFPEHKDPDDAFRKFAGLLKPNSSFYNPWLFGAADATFTTVKSFHPITDGPISKNIKVFAPDKITRFISTWAKELGSHTIGVTPLQEHQLYHTGGRNHNYGEAVHNSHSFAIAFTVEMDFERVRSAPKGPIVMESSAQYLRSGSIAVQIAAFIRSLGYSASAHIDGKYQLRCPEVAKDAGLGELGRMGLLMTPKLGPRVRIAVVTTDIPLVISPPRPDASLLKFCQVCKKCAETCPSQSISFDEPKMVGGTTQWVINQEACFTYWCKVGTDCGRCISVCPYSHPDNLMHNIIRYLIKKSPLFRPLAFRMDNWLYGRKPPEKKLPDWMIPNSESQDSN